MFEQTIYEVIYARYTEDGQGVEWLRKPVKTLTLSMGKVEKVTTEDDQEIVIDDTTAFVRRGTSMFDKVGVQLFCGDIVKFQHSHAGSDAAEVLAPIVWINGAYVVVIPGIEELIYLTQQNVMEMECIGNVYQHGKILETPIDEAIFEVDKQEASE
jgi:hypothetical protein